MNTRAYGVVGLAREGDMRGLEGRVARDVTDVSARVVLGFVRSSPQRRTSSVGGDSLPHNTGLRFK